MLTVEEREALIERLWKIATRVTPAERKEILHQIRGLEAITKAGIKPATRH